MTICNEFQYFNLSVENSKLMAAYGCRYLIKGHLYCLRDCIETRLASQAMCVSVLQVTPELLFIIFLHILIAFACIVLYVCSVVLVCFA